MNYTEKPLGNAIQGNFFLLAPDTSISRMLQDTLDFDDHYPHLLSAIDKDPDQYGNAKLKAPQKRGNENRNMTHDNQKPAYLSDGKSS